MMSIFTLSTLGGLGVSHVLTDVTPGAEAEAQGAASDPGDRAGEMPRGGLGGDNDLLAGVDLRDEAELAATPEDLALLSEGVAPDAHGATGTGAAADEVIALAVDLPGTPEAELAEPTAAGFRTALGPGDELTLNIAPDLPGRVLAVHAINDRAAGSDAVDLACSLNFYILPEGQGLPDPGATGPEAGFMAAHGLTKLGEVDMGRFAAQLDPRTGEVVVTADTRQEDPPRVCVNRGMAEISARFL